MFSDIIIHIMFQVVFATVVFWVVLIPSSKKTVEKTIKEKVDKTISQDTLSVQQKVVAKQLIDKQTVLDLLSNPDGYAYQQNVKVMLMNGIIVTPVIIVGFIMLYLFSCGENLLPIIFELVLTYLIVCIAQVLFIQYVIPNYFPSTESETSKYIIESLEKSCNVIN